MVQGRRELFLVGGCTGRLTCILRSLELDIGLLEVLTALLCPFGDRVEDPL